MLRHKFQRLRLYIRITIGVNPLLSMKIQILETSSLKIVSLPYFELPPYRVVEHLGVRVLTVDGPEHTWTVRVSPNT